jgi:hypothetical protein
MNTEEWKPEPRPSLLPPKPASKWRVVIINTLTFCGFVVACLGVFGRHEIAEYVGEHFSKSTQVKAKTAPSPLPDIAVASNIRIPSNSDAAVSHPLVKPDTSLSSTPRPKPLPSGRPVRISPPSPSDSKPPSPF